MNKVNLRPLQRTTQPAAQRFTEDEQCGMSVMPPAWGGMHDLNDRPTAISAERDRNPNNGPQFDVDNVKSKFKALSFLRGANNMAGGSQGLGQVLAPFSLVSGLSGMYDAYSNRKKNHALQTGSDALFSAAGTFSGAVGTHGLANSINAALYKSAGVAKAGAMVPFAKVAGAGAFGYGVGSRINNAITSDYARNAEKFGTDHSGRARTRNDRTIDNAVITGQKVKDFTGSELVGHVFGGAHAMGGSILNARAGMNDAAKGWLSSKLRRRRR